MSSVNAGEARPPSLVTALRRHLLPAVAVLLAATAGGAALGLSQPVEYVAQAQMVAGVTGVPAGGIPAQAAASQTMAQTYSRVFDGDAVRSGLRETLGEAPAVGASPIPGSGIILIEAAADSPDLAVRAADAGVATLQTVVAGLLDNQATVDTATAALTDANVRLAEAQRALAAAQAVRDSLPTPTADPAVTAAIASATAATATAQAEVDAYEKRYEDAIAKSSPENGVAPLASARVTSDNSMRRLQLNGALGLVAGSVLGAGLAYALEAQAARRRGARRRLAED